MSNSYQIKIKQNITKCINKINKMMSQINENLNATGAVTINKQKFWDQTLQMDEFGFLISAKQLNQEMLDVKQLKQLNARVEQWRMMLPELHQLQQSNNQKLKQRVRKGIPNGIRCQVWPILANIQQLKKESANNYQELINQKSIDWQKIIQLDIDRTYPQHVLFKDSKELGFQSLRLCLKALTLTFQEMGYCQGMNFLGAVFIFYLNDEDSYWMFCSLCRTYQCQQIFERPERVYKHSFILDKLLERFLPKVHQVLLQYEVQTISFAAGWFITLFSSFFPFKFFVHLLDIFLVEGWKIIFRAALEFIKLNENQILLGNDFGDIMTTMRDASCFDEIDSETFFKSATTDFVFSQKIFPQYEKEFQQIENIRKNKEAALVKPTSKLVTKQPQQVTVSIPEENQLNQQASLVKEDSPKINKVIEEKVEPLVQMYQLEEQKFSPAPQAREIPQSVENPGVKYMNSETLKL